jgi:hypothetical protein
MAAAKQLSSGECSRSGVELWFRDDCRVLLTPQVNGVLVEVSHDGTGAGWYGLTALTALRATWPEADIMSPIELATSPQLHAHAEIRSFHRAPGDWLYRKSKPWAHGLKVFLQMFIGIGAAVDIGIHVAHSVSNHTGTAPLAPETKVSVQVIAYALAVAAAIELAYTLFTPGPDDPLDPLMLGLSSAILLLVTSDKPELSQVARYTGAFIGILALGVLFFVRHRFLRDDE